MQIFNTILYPFTLIFANLLMFFYQLISAVHIPFAFAFSIVAMTIALKLITHPLVKKQLHFSKKMQELAPQVANLKKLHKGDQKKILAEQQKLYKEHGVNQLTGCLPTLIQLPFLYAVYILLSNIVSHPATQISYINSLVLAPLRISHPLDTTLLGVSLGKSPSNLLKAMGLAVFLIPIITAVLTLIQSKMMTPIPVKEYKSDSTKEKLEKEEVADMSTQMQSQMLFFVPLLIGYASFNFPLGLSLYWNVSTFFGIIQQYKISGLGGLKSWIERINGKKS